MTTNKGTSLMPIKVSSTVDVREIDDTELRVGAKETIQVHSHWHRDEMVVIEIDGKRRAVSGRELTVAIQNAMRTK